MFSWPVFLITCNLWMVATTSFLYTFGYDRHERTIRYFLDIDRGEYLSGTKQVRDYFKNDEEFLSMNVEIQGIRYSNIFNSREISHMYDVKQLVRGVYWVMVGTFIYLLGFMLVGFTMLGKKLFRPLSRFVVMGASITLALVVFIGIGSIAGFDRLFLIFHQISFTNDFWQLDPRRDYLIAMFPQGFFFDATLIILGFVVLQAILLIVALKTLNRLF